VSEDREAAGQHRYTNRLASQTSPYLQQHAHNPVDWYPWGSEALERAKREDRPIFLSIGYAACHWCHVMERESFEDRVLAELLNREFVAIKVDREERPDIDEVYMAAVQAMTGSGGWPMSVFMTPELEPFYGGTYFPPEDRHGLPGFGRVLAAVADAYRTRREEVAAQSRMLAAHLREQLTVPPGRSDVESPQLEAAARRLERTFDAVHGGFGGAPKFPAPMTLEFLLRVWRGGADASALRMVTRTLDAMAAGGIHDQLGGGFARYSTDAAWLVPHFEKMLYDNAQLAHCYLEAFRATGEPRYRAVVESTLDFVLREMATPDGGFASGLDADSEGEEGRFYVWTDAEFRDTLTAAGLSTEEIASLAAYWDVTPSGNWEGRSILHLAGPAADPGLVERARAALFAARERRVRPARDDKQLAAWNGLLLRALAEAGGALRRDDYLAAAGRLSRFATGVLLRPEGGVWRTARDGQAHTPGFLEDHAFLADGLLAAHAATGAPDDLIIARRLMDRAIVEFWDDDASLFWDSSAEHGAIVARPRSVVDGATPSSNSVAAEVLLRLALLTGESDYDRRARAILRSVGGVIDRQPSAFGRMLAVAHRALAEQVDVVIAADLGDGAAQELRNVALAAYAPDLVITSVAPAAAYGEWPLFESKSTRSGRAMAYVCRGYACEAPTSDPVDMARQIAGLAQPKSASAGKEREPNLPR
jgi:uncharacterized protein YyaL (SSP411 family)